MSWLIAHLRGHHLRDVDTTPPFAFFFLVLPFGIGSGLTTVTLPFALTQAGVPVSTAALIVALGLSANVGLFVWGPLADLTLTPRRWYVIGVASSAATLLLLGTIPLRDNAALVVVVFLSQVSTTVLLPPIGGLMAQTVADADKGKAGGWYQAGIMSSAGVTGGGGVWMVDQVSFQTATAVMAAAMMLCLITLYFVGRARGVVGESLAERFRELAREFHAMVRSPLALVTLMVVLSPIGVAGAARLWSAIAPEWGATPNTVALATGALSAGAGALGCVIGGTIAGLVGRWWAYFGGGMSMVVIACVLAAAPRTPEVYSLGVLFYAFGFGVTNAGFTAVVLHTVGRGAASAKFAIFWSAGNLPLVYSTAFDGWLYDRAGATGMLVGEALLGLCCIAIAVWAVGRVQGGVGRLANRVEV